MSTRTIIEINHDYLQRIVDNDQQALVDFVRGLGHSLDLAMKLSPPPNGIRVLAQRHHTTVLQLEVK